MKATLPGVLVVEHDAGVAHLLIAELRQLPAIVEHAMDAPRAVALTRSRRFALLAIDLMLPGVGGAELCVQLRAAAPGARLLAVTARSDLIGALLGVRTGIDDYALKPVDPTDVRAKARALLDRPARWEPPPEETWDSGELSFQGAERRVRLRGQPVEGISSAEFEVLYFLARHAGRTFTARELAASVWGLHHPINMRNLGINFVKLKEKLARGAHSYLVISRDDQYMFTVSDTALAVHDGQ